MRDEFVPFRPVQHYAPGGAAMVDAIERLERELAAVRRDLSAVLLLIPDLSPALVRGLQRTAPGRWTEVLMGADVGITITKEAGDGARED